jgi:hypothetical protein
MGDQTIEILKLMASVLTPIIILILGILINRTLEKSKAVLSKEKDWQNWWAGKFLSIAHDYNSTVSECVTGLYSLKQIEDEKLSGWEEDLKQKEIAVRLNIRKLQYLDWEIQNYIQFAPNKGKNVRDKQEQLFDLLANLIGTKQGNLEEIRTVQFEFNDSVRLAHAEILEISSN